MRSDSSTTFIITVCEVEGVCACMHAEKKIVLISNGFNFCKQQKKEAALNDPFHTLLLIGVCAIGSQTTKNPCIPPTHDVIQIPIFSSPYHSCALSSTITTTAASAFHLQRQTCIDDNGREEEEVEKLVMQKTITKSTVFQLGAWVGALKKCHTKNLLLRLFHHHHLH